MIKKIVYLIYFIFLLPIFCTSQQIQQFNVNDFGGGLFDKWSTDIIPDNCAQDIQNFYIDEEEDIGLVKRRGYIKDNYTAYSTFPVTNIIDYSRNTGESYKVIICGNYIYHTSATIENLIENNWDNSDTTSVLTWLGEVFFINPNKVLMSWDGNDKTLYDNAPKGRFAIVYGSRLIISGINSNNSVIYWSDINNASSWDFTYNVDYIGKADNDYITGMFVYNGNLYITKNKAIYVIVGLDPLSWEIRNITNEVGCIDCKSIQEFNGYTYFMSRRGIEKFDGINCRKVSDKIDNLAYKNNRSIYNYLNGYGKKQVYYGNTYFNSSTYSSIQIDTTTIPGTLKLNDIYGTANLGNAGTGAKSYNGIAVDSIGNPHIVRKQNNSLYYSSYTKTIDSWTKNFITYSINDGSVSSFQDIALNSSNDPMVCYYYTTLPEPTYDLKFTSYTQGVGWNSQIRTIESVGDAGKYCKIQVDSLGQPHMVWWTENGSNSDIRYSSFTYGIGWSSSTVFGDIPGVYGLDFKLDSKNNAHIVFDYANTLILYSSFTIGSGWSLNVVIYPPESNVFPSLDIDSLDNAWISYTGNNYIAYSSYTYSLRRTDNTKSVSQVPYKSNIVLDKDNVYMIYDLNDVLYYSYNDYGLWTTNILSSFGRYSDMAKKGNYIHCIYVDGNNNLIYYGGALAGTYVTTPIKINNNFSSWGNFVVSDLNSGGYISYYIRNSTYSFSSNNNPAWRIINKNDLLTGTTPYIQLKIVFGININENHPKIDGLSFYWYYNNIPFLCASAVYKDHYWLSISTITGTITNNTIIVMDNKDNFTKFQGIEASSLGLYNDNLYSGSALNDGFVYKQDIAGTYTDNGKPISAYWVSKDYNMGTGLNEKSYQTVWLTAMNDGSTINLNYSLDCSTYVWSKTIPTIMNDVYRLRIEKIPLEHNVRSRQIKFKITNEDGYNVNIRRIDCQYLSEQLR
jgi:hypothetical protein